MPRPWREPKATIPRGLSGGDELDGAPHGGAFGFEAPDPGWLAPRSEEPLRLALDLPLEVAAVHWQLSGQSLGVIRALTGLPLRTLPA